MRNSTSILGVKITTTSEEKILEYLVEELRKPKEHRDKVVIFTPNPEQISAANSDPRLKTMLNTADISLPDGVGVVLAAKLLGKPIEARVTGVDFMVELAKRASIEAGRNSKQTVKTGCFGGQKGVAIEAAKCLQKIAANLQISYASYTYDKEKMRRSDVDLFFVGLGFPKQEKWILEHKDEIPASVIMAVGGSFDFLWEELHELRYLSDCLGSSGFLD